MSAARRVISLCRWAGAILCSALGLAACNSTVVGDGTANEIELANIAPSNIAPATSPRQLIDTFERVCLAPSLAAAREVLERLDYVPARPSATAAGVETYFSNNRRPAVGLRPAPGGYDCVLNVTARTGQANAVARFVAERFPSAQPRTLDGTERFWLVPDAGGGQVFTRRQGRPARPERYFFGVLRPVTLNPSPTPAG